MKPFFSLPVVLPTVRFVGDVTLHDDDLEPLRNQIVARIRFCQRRPNPHCDLDAGVLVRGGAGQGGAVLGGTTWGAIAGGDIAGGEGTGH